LSTLGSPNYSVVERAALGLAGILSPTQAPIPQLNGIQFLCAPSRLATEVLKVERRNTMRSIILYVLGVPVSIIIIIALFAHHF
jgi:hypothetical protein